MAPSAILLLLSAHAAAAFQVASPSARSAVASRAHIRLMAGPQPGILSKLPLRQAVIALIAFQSAYGLSNDVPSLFGESPDVLGTVVDAGFLVYSAQLLAAQTGLVPAAPSVLDLSGLTCTATLNLGREPGTWMPQEWAASGARLSLPLELRFSDEPVDLGFPGEEVFGGRAARRLVCEGGSFVGPQGEVKVAAAGGAWAVEPSGQEGEGRARFFLDFPDGAARNDVSLPAGRVYFSCACWESAERIRQLDGAGTAAIEALPVVGAPSGAQLLTRGGLNIKRNGPSNLFGAFGDVYLILGKFTLQAS